MHLKTARKLKGLTQADLASLTGILQTTISDIETGRNANPSWEKVKRIADALGVRPEEIFPVPDKREVA